MKAHHRMGCLLAALLVGFTPKPSQAAVLGPGQTLPVGQPLASADGTFFAALTPDGNFAIYRSIDHAIAWSSGTSGTGAVAVTMQRTGRLELLNAAGKIVWATPTRGRHRVFGVTNWGTAMVVDARRWKPRPKGAEPIIEKMLRQRGRIHWQSKSFDKPARWRELNSPS
jgi:hypothetical protein